MLIWAGALGVAALLSASRANTPPKVFSHRAHLGFEFEKGGTVHCPDCHLDPKKEGLPQLDEQFCDRCHDAYGTPAWKIGAKARSLRNIDFEHFAHTRDTECTDCHQITAQDSRSTTGLLVTPDECLACHDSPTAKKPIAQGACPKCHKRDPKTLLPRSHTRTWERRHGVRARWRKGAGHGQRCSECHRDAACVACHRKKSPVSHTGLWRMRLHGTAAQWDRDSCKTCHQTGACVSCHRRTPPLNHRGAWKSTHGIAAGVDGNERCTTCHQRAWCIACHKGRGR